MKNRLITIFEWSIVASIMIFAIYVAMSQSTEIGNLNLDFNKSSASMGQNGVDGLEEEGDVLAAKIMEVNSIISNTKNLANVKAKDANYSDLRDKLKSRKNQLVGLAKINPDLASSLLLAKNYLDAVPSSLKSLVESSVNIRGASLGVINYDDFDDKQGDTEYYVNHNGKRIKIYSRFIDNKAYLPGTKIDFSGYQIDDGVYLALANSGVKVVGGARKTKLAESQKLLTILVKFADTVTPGFTREQIDNLVFNGEVQNYYAENTFSKTKLIGKTIGWYTIPRNINNQCRFEDFPYFSGDAANDEVYRLIKNDVDVSDYDHFLLIAPSPCSGGSATGSMDIVFDGAVRTISFAQVGGVNINLNRYGSWTIVHELGHSIFNVFHARRLVCKTVVSGDCYTEEYGNFFDIMGGAVGAWHFNLGFKDLAGFIDNDKLLSITSSGSYRIKPLEIYGDNLGAKVAIPGGYAYIEYRRPIGFDSRLSDNLFAENIGGVLINYLNEGSRSTNLISLDPNINGFNVALTSGKIFRDDGRGIEIKNVGLDENGQMGFDVNFFPPTCVREFSYNGFFTEYYVPFNVGYYKTLIDTISNLDSPTCGESRFIETIISPPGISITKYPSSGLVLAPNSTGVFIDRMEIGSNTVPGNHEILFKVVNQNSGVYMDRIMRIKVNPPSDAGILVTNPNTSESWVMGEIENITWSSQSVSAPVYVYAVAQSSGIKYLIADKVENIGTYRWIVGKKLDGSNLEAGEYKILIEAQTNMGEVYAQDQSDQSIKIVTDLDEEYDFNCDGSISTKDVDVISKLWREGSSIDINLVTSSGSRCENLGEYLGDLWRRGIKNISIDEVTRLGNIVRRLGID